MITRSVIVQAFLALAMGYFSSCVMYPVGTSGGVGFIPEATRTRGAPWKVVCFDQKEANRRVTIEESGEVFEPWNGPPVYYISEKEYEGGCEQTGESSVFFLFHMWPVTEPLHPEYALGQAVQSLEGDTMIRAKSWEEQHVYFVLGRVSVYKVRGDVIKFLTVEETEKARKLEIEKKKKPR